MVDRDDLRARVAGLPEDVYVHISVGELKELLDVYDGVELLQSQMDQLHRTGEELAHEAHRMRFMSRRRGVPDDECPFEEPDDDD